MLPEAFLDAQSRGDIRLNAGHHSADSAAPPKTLINLLCQIVGSLLMESSQLKSWAAKRPTALLLRNLFNHIPGPAIKPGSETLSAGGGGPEVMQGLRLKLVLGSKTCRDEAGEAAISISLLEFNCQRAITDNPILARSGPGEFSNVTHVKFLRDPSKSLKPAPALPGARLNPDSGCGMGSTEFWSRPSNRELGGDLQLVEAIRDLRLGWEGIQLPIEIFGTGSTVV
ncbi:hypothetical protein K438DRAFT_1770423 [Mycena galopus ATCC 62051]|nr:hypothetical protein K438DRAFT_1770423 [Mycena galopus ATCC 62051]